MSPARPRRLLTALAVVAVLAVGACGDDDAGAGADGPGQDAGATTEPLATPGPDGQCAAPPELPTELPTFEEVPATDQIRDRDLEATITTTCGPIVVELYAEQAPQTVASFEFLAAQGYWADSPCHRLTTEGLYVLQCGDPTGTGRGGPGYTFGIENAPEDGQYPAGTLAMARTVEPDSNGGQFFIVHDDTELPVEGGGYSIFGKVTEGMSIIDRIADAGVDGGGADGMPAQPISILKVDVNEKKA